MNVFDYSRAIKLEPDKGTVAQCCWGRGCIELIDALVRYDPMANSLCQGKDIFPSVYDYKVSAPFGKWFGEYIMEHGDQPPLKEAINWLNRETEAFFAQGQAA